MIDVDVYRIRLSVKKNQPTELSIRPCGGGIKLKTLRNGKNIYIYYIADLNSC